MAISPILPQLSVSTMDTKPTPVDLELPPNPPVVEPEVIFDINKSNGNILSPEPTNPDKLPTDEAVNSTTQSVPLPALRD